MKKLASWVGRHLPLVLAAFLVSSVAMAASWTTVAPWIIMSGTDGTSPQPLKITSNGELVTGGSIASGATDSGNPVKVGCVYNSTKPTVTNGQRVDVQCGTRGSVSVQLYGPDSTTAIDSSASDSDGANGAVNGYFVRAYNYLSNGSTRDREFTCTSTAVVNVAAAATTQIVALSASTVIRVCSFVISGDTLATTATFVYGTGANCATGQTAITGAMRLQDEGNISISSGNGSVLRGLAANALCLTAATGAVTGFVTYAQY